LYVILNTTDSHLGALTKMMMMMMQGCRWYGNFHGEFLPDSSIFNLF